MMETMKARLYWLMGLRVVVVTLLLGLSLGVQISQGERERLFSGLIAFAYAVTVPYLLVVSRLNSDRVLTWVAYSQVALDLTLETLLVAKTGGIESPFVVLYVISVSLSSLVPGRHVAPVAGAVALALFGGIARVQAVGGTFPEGLLAGEVSGADAWRVWGLNSVAFLVVGLLSGALADQLRQADRTLHEKTEGLAQLQVFHENVVQSISSGVFTTDRGGRITTFNRAALEIMGYALDEVEGRDWQDLFNWHAGPDDLTELDRSIPSRLEVECKRSDGARLILGVTMAPLHERGVQTGCVGVFKDLTEVRELEEEMRRKEWLAKLGEMSAGMAHEIRNPLGALAGAMQILRKEAGAEDESSRHLMDIAVREARRLDEIITAFLQYAKPPALNLAEVDINHLLSETLELIQHEAGNRKGITLATHLSQGPLLTQADPNQMKQVFWNLATNGFDAMKKGGGRLTIVTGHRWIEAREHHGDVVEIAFEDTGEGISKEHLDKIFLPFFTTKQTGSGLGLAAVHRIVDQHGGWIRVESQPGQGARFIVCLPRVTDEPRLSHEGRGPWKKYS